MTVTVELDEKQYGLLCRQEQVQPLMLELSRLYGMIWAEACYDAYNQDTQTFARKCLPHIQAANEILRFKK